MDKLTAGKVSLAAKQVVYSDPLSLLRSTPGLFPTTANRQYYFAAKVSMCNGEALPRQTVWRLTKWPNRNKGKETMSKKVFLSAALAVGMLVGTSGAFAADGAELFKSKTCASCHGMDAKTPIMPNYPKLAGQNEAYLVEQLKDIKSGARSNGQTAAMKGIMAMVSDEDIDAIAKYLSTL